MAEIGPYATVSTGLDIAGLRDTIHILKTAVNRFDHDPTVRSAAQRITAAIPNHDDTGQIAAIYHWLLTYVAFRKDPSQKELIESPAKILRKVESGQPVGIDCDDFVVLAGALLQALGHDVRFAIEGTQQAGIFEHIHLEVYDESAGQWYAFDPALSNAPLGTPLQGLLSRWVESARSGAVGWPPAIGVIDAELGDTHPCAIGLAPDDYPLGAVVHVGDRQWVRDGAEDNGARYWRYAGWLGTDAAVGQNKEISIDIVDGAPVESLAGNHALGKVEPITVTFHRSQEKTVESERVGLEPIEMESRVRDYSNENQEIYILLTQPDINPVRLRRLFGFRRPPSEREKWRREYWRNADFQSSLPLETQVTLGKDYIKVPMPGFTDGNSAAQLLEHFYQWRPGRLPFGGGDPGGAPPSWKDLVPDPDELFGRGFGQGLWSQLAGSILQDNISVQALIDFGMILTGRDLAPELNGTNLAASVMISSDMFFQESRMQQGTLGEPITIGAIMAIIMGVLSAIAAITTGIAKIVEGAKEVADPIIGLMAEWETKRKQLGEDAAAAAEQARNIRNSMEGWSDDPVGEGQDWLEGYRDNQQTSMTIAIARDALDRYYLDVLQWGFSASNTRLYRAEIKKIAQLGPMFYLLAKERTLRDLRQLKISALAGMTGAFESYKLMLDDMKAAGDLIQAWADEYASLPFDTDNIEIPGAPDPNPPTDLPPGNYPWEKEDDPPENPFLNEDELGDIFDREKKEGAASGITWSVAGDEIVGWAGPVIPEKEMQRVTVAPGISVDIAPGAGGTNEVTIDEETGRIDVIRRETIGAGIKAFVRNHPIIAAAGAVGTGYGLFRLFKKMRGA